MKTRYYILVGWILVVVLINVYIQQIGKPPSIQQVGQPPKIPLICDNEVSKIHLCENSQGNKLYLQISRCEDCPSLYFDINKNFIQRCGGRTRNIPEACKRLGDYICDFEENLFDIVCK